MKRNCNGCRALDRNNDYFTCDLGYKIEQLKVERVFNIGGKPLEECPKPKTYDEYLKLKGY
jgi:hypothetical protein